MSSKILKALVYLGAIITFSVLIFIISYIAIKGIPNLSPKLFALKYTSENVSLLPALVTTVMMTALALLTAVPLGVFSAIYLVEYASKSNPLVRWVRITTETLSGIPSIVYGLFGMLFFVSYLKFGYSLLAGSLTLSIMILPLVMRSAEEALLAVSDTFREGSFGLGAGRLRTTFKIVLPSAAKGILAGCILAIGRIVGETAALIYTAGTVPQIPGTSKGGNVLFDSGRSLSVHMNSLSSEGLHMGEAYATAVVLLLTVLLINALAAYLAGKLSGEK